jgi:hypothetical protein
MLNAFTISKMVISISILKKNKLNKFIYSTPYIELVSGLIYTILGKLT